MLTFANLFVRRGEKVILDGVSFTIHGRQHVGLVGPNGAGKSTLFELIMGRLLPEDGDVQLSERTRIAHLAQHTPDTDQGALDFVLDGDRELRRVEREIATAEREGRHQALGALHAQMDAIDGYSAPARAGAILHGLGFGGADQQRSVNDFSGGWRMRLALARTLMQPADLLLLDEPTNHLDLDATLWLERWLSRLDTTLILISHDRDFLDRTVQYIAHIDRGQVTMWRGNYSAFERQRAEAMLLQQATYEKHQKRAAEIQRFVDRFRAKATKARQVQSRLKTLEQLSQTAAVRASSPFRFQFRDPVKMSDPLLDGEHLTLGYPDHRVLDDVRLRLHPGDRIGLLGPNGAGKSTLIRTLAGGLTPLSGEITRGHHAPVAWFAQHQVEQLRPGRTPMQHLLELDRGTPDQGARNFLGGFGFGRQAEEPIDTFSGGERARLVLALLAWQRPALLLLDEPTNHLDLDMREALSLALGEFSGAVVLVSHDRHLLRETMDEFWLVADGRIVPWDGDLDDYARWLLDRDRDTPEVVALEGTEAPEGQGSAIATADASLSRADRQAERRAAAERRKALQPLKTEIQKLEQQLDTLQQRLAEIEGLLADASLYEDGAKDRLTAALKERGELRARAEGIESAWLEASERYEELSTEV
ncbi:MAG: ATP-binding cassette domain-containing protein [Gammaproteobacteria bacterium]|nr:ATP-binding cassette domain-containing protein [Gammaproteobacteria bacterium]